MIVMKRVLMPLPCLFLVMNVFAFAPSGMPIGVLDIPHALAQLPDNITLDVEGEKVTIPLDSIPELKQYLSELTPEQQQLQLRVMRARKAGTNGDMIHLEYACGLKTCENVLLIKKPKPATADPLPVQKQDNWTSVPLPEGTVEQIVESPEDNRVGVLTRTPKLNPGGYSSAVTVIDTKTGQKIPAKNPAEQGLVSGEYQDQHIESIQFNSKDLTIELQKPSGEVEKKKVELQ